VDPTSTLADPVNGLVAAIGVITGIVVSDLRQKRTRHQIALDLAQAVVVLTLVAGIFYLVPAAVGQPLGFALQVGVGGIALIVLWAVFVHRLLSTA
jgi:hypothetical protein